jgi:hypothetical protein
LKNAWKVELTRLVSSLAVKNEEENGVRDIQRLMYLPSFWAEHSKFWNVKI